MSYPPSQPELIQHQDIAELSICSVFTVLLLAQIFFRKGSVRFHYHLVLLSNVFGLIGNALSVSITHYSPSVDSTNVARMVLSSFSMTFTYLAALFALRQFTVTYLGGARTFITIMCSLAVAYTPACIVIAGIYATFVFSFEADNREEVIQLITFWSNFAFAIWTILTLVAIRIFYHRKTPRDETRRPIITIFALLGLFVVMISIIAIYDTIIWCIPLKDYSIVPALNADIVMRFVLFRGSTLLFIIFFQKLAVMAPLSAIKRETTNATGYDV